ncbi:MAG: DUF5777 family beta-barrel protein [Acidobacteriota bacterium]
MTPLPGLRRFHTLIAAALALALLAATGAAQTPAPPPAPEDDPDLDINFAQPDFTVIALPTTLRVPKSKSAFRVTHRFARPLGAGDFGSLLEDFFGFDAGAQIGLEYRFGLLRGTQVGIHRTSDRTIQFFTEHSLRRQGAAAPVGLAVVAAVDGTDNFRDEYSPSLGLVLSREIADRAALYAQPIWVNNVNIRPGDARDDYAVLLGLAARLRVRPSVYLVVEGAPRVAGYDGGADHVSFGIEKRSGGHSFQINFSNGFGTTMAQIARGGTASDDWYIGFNISRKFF